MQSKAKQAGRRGMAPRSRELPALIDRDVLARAQRRLEAARRVWLRDQRARAAKHP